MCKEIEVRSAEIGDGFRLLIAEDNECGRVLYTEVQRDGGTHDDDARRMIYVDTFMGEQSITRARAFADGWIRGERWAAHTGRR